ncbi:unnamed protein product [Caenorhabditis sp. 36 PRJEB53466]|nr:unnamed protein product [Caenorhabditis sp. 36 PRJEB53466]
MTIFTGYPGTPPVDPDELAIPQVVDEVRVERMNVLLIEQQRLYEWCDNARRTVGDRIQPVRAYIENALNAGNFPSSDLEFIKLAVQALYYWPNHLFRLNFIILPYYLSHRAPRYLLIHPTEDTYIFPTPEEVAAEQEARRLREMGINIENQRPRTEDGENSELGLSTEAQGDSTENEDNVIHPRDHGRYH